MGTSGGSNPQVVRHGNGATGLMQCNTAHMNSVNLGHVCARCVGGPRNGDTYDLDVEPADTSGIQAMIASGGRSLAERYRLIDQETTTGERILVYIGEPRAW